MAAQGQKTLILDRLLGAEGSNACMPRSGSKSWNRQIHPICCWQRSLEQSCWPAAQTLGIVDVLDVFKSHHILGAASIRVATWPARALLAGFKLFFTMVLLHQIFASLRQGKLLAETITDFWSPHDPIHERARDALPAFGAVTIGPLLRSL